MSSSSRAPLPHLPVEVKGRVLRFCDQATLAVTSRVSLAFLELSIPILHDDIHIKELETVQKLLCSRVGQTPSSIDSILSLRRIRALTIVSTYKGKSPINVSLDRLADGSSLAVSQLTLGLGIEWNCRWNSLTPVFDPEAVRIFAFNLEPGKHAELELEHVPWHGLRSLELSGCMSGGFLNDIDFIYRRERAEGIVPLILTCHFAEEGWSPSLWIMILCDLSKCRHKRDMFGPTSRLAEVVVRVSTENDKERAIKMQTLSVVGVPEPERTRRLAMIRYEVTPVTSAPDTTAT